MEGLVALALMIDMEWKTFFDILTVLCAAGTAYLAFKARFMENLISQCKDLMGKEDKDFKKHISQRYRFFAYTYLGIKSKYDWMQIFGDPTSEIKKRMNYDKSDAVRGLGWTVASVIFALISIFLYS